MRRPLLALVALAALAACTDSTPTGTRPRAPDRIRADVVTPATLEQGIEEIIAFWPPNKFNNLMSPWIQIENKIAAGQMKDARLKFWQFVKLIIHETPNMGLPTTGESREAAAARMIIYTWYYVFGDDGPDTSVPDFETGGDVVVGLLEPGKPLTLVTPSGHAGGHWDKGSVNENRVIVITQNLTTYGPCQGPLPPTPDCQYPLFYHFESFPGGTLLKPAVADICLDPHPDEHDDLVLAHTDPNNPNGVEYLTSVPADFIDCTDIGEGLVGDRSLLGRASALASRAWKLLAPKSAYAIDQGAGGAFLDFSPFNWVLPCGIECSID